MKVLVYGGTGSQGGAVVKNLLKRGHQAYVLTRNPEKAQPLVDHGARVVKGDMSDRSSLFEASKGMDGVALMVPAFIPDPFQAPVYAHNAIDAAREARIDLLVYNTSGTVINQPTGNPMYDMRLDLINYLDSSGVPYVTIEPTAYMENLLGPWTRPNIIERDTLSYPVETDTKLGWIATEDVGALMVAALERPQLANRRIGVSGVENVTGPELAARFSKGLGRDISYYAMPLEEFGAALDAAFGPGAGEGGIQGYKFQRENKDLLTMWWDMGPVLDMLPVQMTPIAGWAARHKAAFETAGTTKRA
ncbi:MAG: SDR family oxidoreductase [Chloroflexota bacterium]